MLILASNSPRRREILAQAGLNFTVDASEVDENIAERDPAALVEELSYRKAKAVASRHPSSIILGADTVVSIVNDTLGKPKNEEDAAKMLRLLSGKTHEVRTGVTILSTDETGEERSCKTFHETTAVTFYDLSEEEIQSYIETKEPLDKAGAYGIQGKGALLVKSINGDYLNVVGLPLARLNRELSR